MGILSEQEINDIVRSDLRDPFKTLGMHWEKKGISVRAFLPEAAAVAVCGRGRTRFSQEMAKVNEAGVFELAIPAKKKFFKYEFSCTLHDGSQKRIIDPYGFLPVMTEDSRYLFNEGTHQRVYDDLGSHEKTVGGEKGCVFAVWAPNAKRVSLVGNFNGWDGRRHPMRLLGSSGVWELFVPGIGTGAIYKYEIKKYWGDHLILKTDPYGYRQEPPPNHASIVADLDAFTWEDTEWIERRAKGNLLKQPMSIYEVHLGSWRKAGPRRGGDWLSYRDLAVQLAQYVKEMGFTHVELLPVQDHPYEPSWGYQVCGFYAPNHRFGPPQDFQFFVNHLHKNGIGVIIDWVPGHFPKDSYGLAHFDGSHLYEYEDPREGEHKDWGTLIFNWGRHEVRNFLFANALFWIEKFHVDGLRVDAVASMLYRNYSRKNGEWIPNRHGGVENEEAVNFLQTMNRLVHEKFPGAVTIAEESTAWPLVSRPTYLGGLGFTFKWNMGWMNDILLYFSKEPVHRKYHQGQITFALWYAFTENFILVVSHDEVVHGKRSLIEKMPGDVWRKFANVRAFFGFMFGHPGKKLMFQGCEFGMHWEWDAEQSINWHILSEEDDCFHHNGLMRLIRDLNRLYKNEPALWEQDYEQAGFTWIDFHDSDNSIIAFIRRGREWHNILVFVCNFTPVVRRHYRIGVPFGGRYDEIFNTDAKEYGGAGYGNDGGRNADMVPIHNQPLSLDLSLPPLSVLIFKWKR
ncbi:MAG TPA: 1,4-alpha-glucan branching protein GlgB [Chitinivibrionales bacterium]|nr:1,4-alpha-glucan branching protein GlgB [Chitinivibrionales bacterium]